MESERTVSKDVTPSSCLVAFESTRILTPPLPTAYEAARSKFDVDINDLAMLTNFNVGKATTFALSTDPSRLMTLLGHQKWSYLQFVPSQYGLSGCLTAATDCLLAKVRSLLVPSKANEAAQLRLYTRALRSLQDALQNDTECGESDVLCATQLLSLHEVRYHPEPMCFFTTDPTWLISVQLLDASTDTAWSHHVSGSVRLVRHRTPDRFNSEFDHAMFAAHVGPVAIESLRGNNHCYLASPRWMRLYHSIARDSDHLDDRSPLAIEVRSQMFILPGLWHDIDEAVKGPKFFDNENLITLTSRCQESHRVLVYWLAKYEFHCLRLSLTSPSLQELSMRRELLGIGLECLAVIKRLLSTIHDEERANLEVEVQTIAASIFDLQKQTPLKHSWLFSGHEIGIARSVMVTTEQWQGSVTYCSEYERKVSVRERYVTWSSMLRASPGTG